MSFFGPTYIVEPREGYAHTHTAVLLHGRGSTGEEFAEELFETALSDPQKPSLADCLPSWRWVFPSSPKTWNATFEEWMPAWFEAQSLADPTERQDLQQAGLQTSARHAQNIVEDEIQRLQIAQSDGSDAHLRVVLGGISLGGAVALWTLLGTDKPERPLGGFAVMSTWLPFAKESRSYLAERDPEKEAAQSRETDADNTEPVEPLVFARNSMVALRKHLQIRQADPEVSQATAGLSILTTPVYVGHGRDDAYVDVELGLKLHKLLVAVGFTRIEWQDYEGSEQEGHWLKEPEQMDDIARFLEAVSSRR